MKASRTYKIVKPGEVYPQVFHAGDDLPEWAHASAIADGAAVAAGKPANAPAADPAPPQPPAAPTLPAADGADGWVDSFTAKTVRACKLVIDGKETRFKTGVTVYGDIARELVASHNAVEIRAVEGAPQQK